MPNKNLETFHSIIPDSAPRIAPSRDNGRLSRSPFQTKNPIKALWNWLTDFKDGQNPIVLWIKGVTICVGFLGLLMWFLKLPGGY